MHLRRTLLAACTAGLILGLTACADDGAPAEDADTTAAEMGSESAQSSEDAAAGETDAAEGTAAGDMATGDGTAAPSDTGAEADASPPGVNLQAGVTLERIRERGELICGVNDQLPGFGFITASGDSQGFDVDFCRAFAAAIFGDPTRVRFRPLTAQERFTALQTGEIDVLSRNTTWTLTRDTENGLDFGPTTFYDGQGVMVAADTGVGSLEDLAGAAICVQSGTTTEKNISDAMRRIGADYEPIVFDEPDQTFGAYESGRCDAVTSDKSQLISRKSVLADPSAHVILDATLSKEPLGPAVLQGDPSFADLITWVVFGTFTAEELGMNSENVDTFGDSEDPEVLRFLGAEGSLGQALGVENDFMVDVITAVGNYQEIYDRNLGPDTAFDLPEGPNKLWTEGGLLYAPPFR